MAAQRRYDYAMNLLLPSLLLWGWRCRMDREPVEGDIVILQSAPPSEWHISIYRGRSDGGTYDCNHLLESLKTGKLCNWTNVGFFVLNKKECNINELWEWTDEQFDFSDKMNKVRRRADFYLALPFIDNFDGEMVSIKFRTRFSFNDKITEVPEFEWRKITQKSLMAKLLEYEAIHKQKDAA